MSLFRYSVFLFLYLSSYSFFPTDKDAIIFLFLTPRCIISAKLSIKLRIYFLWEMNSNDSPSPNWFRPGAPAESVPRQRQQPVRDRGSISPEETPFGGWRWRGRCRKRARWRGKRFLLREQRLCARVGRGGRGAMEGEFRSFHFSIYFFLSPWLLS